MESTPDVHRWKAKYYKVTISYSVPCNPLTLLVALQGLGTSKDEDARDYFSAMGKHMIPFSTMKEGERELLELAFSKKKADDRKEWLRGLEVRRAQYYATASTYVSLGSLERISTMLPKRSLSQTSSTASSSSSRWLIIFDPFLLSLTA